jgi:hypothetical protein
VDTFFSLFSVESGENPPQPFTHGKSRRVNACRPFSTVIFSNTVITDYLFFLSIL